MKVTLLIATCTLVVLLQQMQISMATPVVDRPLLLEVLSELLFHSIVYHMIRVSFVARAPFWHNDMCHGHIIASYARVKRNLKHTKSAPGHQIML